MSNDNQGINPLPENQGIAPTYNPKPQANTLDELMLRFRAEMFTYRDVLNPTTEWSKLTAHQRSVVNTYRSEFEALITKARADERKAMLDAKPEKMDEANIEGIPQTLPDYFNHAIDLFESAIKLTGGEK